MSIESRCSQYGTVFTHWQVGERLGGGSGGKTGVFRLVRRDAPQVTSAMKAISLIEERGRLEDLPDYRRREYEIARQQCTESAYHEVLLMLGLEGYSNIVDYKDHGFVDWTDETGFGRDMLIRMELLQDLRGKLARDQHFTEEEALRVGRDICTALVICHKKNILHRDIKPENIFINADGNYKLGDFGVSRILSAAPSAMASTGVGTPEYAAPEQFTGKHDKRVDIYSLGLVLYELMNRNCLPFAASRYVMAEAVQKRQLGMPLPSPCEASDGMAEVILKACAFRPEDRYQTAQELLDALSAVSETCHTVLDPSVEPKTEEEGKANNEETYPTQWDSCGGNSRAEIGTRGSERVQAQTVGEADSDILQNQTAPAEKNTVQNQTGAAAVSGGTSQNQTTAATGGGTGWYPKPIAGEEVEVTQPPKEVPIPGNHKNSKLLLSIMAILVAGSAVFLTFRNRNSAPEPEDTKPPAVSAAAGQESEVIQTEPAPAISFEMQMLDAANAYAEAGEYGLAIQTIWDAQKTKDVPEFTEALKAYYRATSTYRIAAGKRHSVAIQPNGTVLTRGYSEEGTCDTSAWTDVVSVAAGDYHVMGLTSTGRVLVDGPAKYHTGTSEWRDITVIAAGDGHCVGLHSDGTLEAVGLNANGQCNVQDLYSDSPIVSIAAGYEHTVALHADGTVTAIGRNNLSQCEVSEWRDIIAICAGSEHTVGLRADGTVVATGKNVERQCNVNDWVDITAISAGDYYTVGLKADGTVVAVGLNAKGQCYVNDWTNVVEIAAGNMQTLGLCTEGSILYTGEPAYRLS